MISYTPESYALLATVCADKLGGQRALARQLGIGHSVIAGRIAHPHRIKREHILALEQLAGQLGIGGMVNARRQNGTLIIDTTGLS